MVFIPELFERDAIGEDSLRVINECLNLRGSMNNEVSGKLPHVRSTAKWAVNLQKGKN